MGTTGTGVKRAETQGSEPGNKPRFCPRCGSDRLYPSHRRGAGEKMLAGDRWSDPALPLLPGAHLLVRPPADPARSTTPRNRRSPPASRWWRDAWCASRCCGG